MGVTASMVKELRERTGAGMMDCKKALVETSGNIEKAIELLREKGLRRQRKIWKNCCTRFSWTPAFQLMVKAAAVEVNLKLTL